MGITWIIGILVIEVEELFVLAYIFTIFVAFQGLFIFITFVLVSESKWVKELYRKWWKGKVAESDFLSKYFGEKTLTSTLVSQLTVTVTSMQFPWVWHALCFCLQNSQHYVTEMSTVPCEKGLLAPNQAIDMEDGSSSQADAGNLGSYLMSSYSSPLLHLLPLLSQLMMKKRTSLRKLFKWGRICLGKGGIVANRELLRQCKDTYRHMAGA